MWFWKRKEEVKAMSSVLLALLVCCAFFVFVKFSLPAGERTEYYLNRASSQADIVSGLEPEELFFLEGESVTYETENGETFAKALIRRFRARVFAEETVCGVRSYYCYSPALSSCATIEGFKINLHIAVRGNVVKAGTPIIFGGF